MVVDGTDFGIVTTVPTGTPTQDNVFTMSDRSRVCKITTTDAMTVNEMGWYAGSAQEGVNFEIGIYAANGAGGNAGTLLYSDKTNSLTAGEGWQRVTGLSWSLSAATTYFIGIQVDAGTATIKFTNVASTYRYQSITETTLSDPYGTSAYTTSRIFPIYIFEGTTGGYSGKVQGITGPKVNGIEVAKVNGV